MVRCQRARHVGACPHNDAMTDRTIRFALGEASGLSSLSWRVWVSGADAYISCRDNYRVLKVSLHRSGRWRIGLTSAGADATAHFVRLERTERGMSGIGPIPRVA